MSKIPNTVLILVVLSLLCGSAIAQSSEFAITAGGNFPSNNAYDSNASFAVGAQYSGRILYLPLVSLYADFPLVVAPKSVVDLPSRSNYRSWFFTPGLKVKIAPEFPASPFFVVGGGFAHYRVEDGTGAGNSTTTGVWEFGGGLDVKVFPMLSLRGEIRDFYSGDPDLRISSESGRQHNIVPQVGLVFRF